MIDVFLSYSRHDAEWVAELDQALTSHGLDTWVDVRDIPISTPWLDEIADAVEECSVFVRCESAARRSSAACAAEDSIAEERGKPQVGVLVDDDLGATTGRVLAALEKVTTVERLVNELRVRARDWDRGGRRGRDLVGWVSTARMAHALRGWHAANSGDPDSWRTAVRFIRAARRRRRVRQAAGTSAVAAVVTVVALVVGLQSVHAKSTRTNDYLASGYSAAASTRGTVRLDPYVALAAASRVTSIDLATDADLIDQALSVSVPDDVIRVPGGAYRFVQRPIGDIVQASSINGTVWSRAAGAIGVRMAVRGTRPKAMPRLPNTGLTVQVDTVTGMVVIRRQGKLVRKAVVVAATGLTAVSPDQRWVAVARAGGPAVVNLDSGLVRVNAEGALGSLADLAWSADGSRIWAIANHDVISWQFRTGRVLRSETGAWFQAIGPSVAADALWLIARSGAVREIARADGAQRAAFRIPDTVISAVISANGTTAYAAGLAHDWLISLTDHTVRRFSGDPVCDGSVAALTPSGRTLLLGCPGLVVAHSTSTESVVATFNLQAGGAVTAITVLPSGQIAIGTRDGMMFETDGNSTIPTRVKTFGCRPYLRQIAVSARGDLLPVGDGDTIAGCMGRGLATDNAPLHWDALIDAVPRATTALAAAFDTTGDLMMVGYYDGTLLIRPTKRSVPVTRVLDIDGSARSMVVLGTTLYVATRTGLLQAIPLSSKPETNITRAALARSEVLRARDLGLTSVNPDA